MHVAPTFESVVEAQHANLLRNLSDAAQAAEERTQRKAVSTLTDTSQDLLSINTGAAFATDSARGQNLDIKV